MMHTRRHDINEVPDLDALVDRLFGDESPRSWTLCTGWRLGDLVLVNDSTSEDGAQEWSVSRGGRQVESLTVSWMTPASFRATMGKLIAREPAAYDYGAENLRPHPKEGCIHCW